jgi:hypothetical protein
METIDGYRVCVKSERIDDRGGYTTKVVLFFKTEDDAKRYTKAQKAKRTAFVNVKCTVDKVKILHLDGEYFSLKPIDVQTF